MSAALQVDGELASIPWNGVRVGHYLVAPDGSQYRCTKRLHAIVTLENRAGEFMDFTVAGEPGAHLVQIVDPGQFKAIELVIREFGATIVEEISHA